MNVYTNHIIIQIIKSDFIEYIYILLTTPFQSDYILMSVDLKTNVVHTTNKILILQGKNFKQYKQLQKKRNDKIQNYLKNRRDSKAHKNFKNKQILSKPANYKDMQFILTGNTD